MRRKTNKLIHEKSPYLLQHAYNPVNWYPWGQEAFDKAKAEDKPLFVSIGYSSCHWCHVMEQECFKDAEVAMLMNLAFVCVKVDREERPDLDATYMAVCQAMGRNCGWPLNILLTPNGKPFFVASYIPKNSKLGMVGMVDLVPQIIEIWRLHRVDIESTGDKVKNRIEALGEHFIEKEITKEVFNKAYEQLVMDFDEVNGGFGVAPKFPRPHVLLFLLRYWKRTGNKNALAIVEKTLSKMRAGGIFDQVGSGFHRYSTDPLWLVPHFEKMLYDQALLALTYTEGYQAIGADRFKRDAEETLNYVLKELASPQGGFYTAEDADSEGKEGEFYLWTRQEVKDSVLPEDMDLAVKIFGVEAQGNYYDPVTQDKNGKNILYLPESLEKIASDSGLTMDELIARLNRIRSALYNKRKQRIAPMKDDKILTDWNGLIIAAFAKAGRVFENSTYIQAATSAADFILNSMRAKDGTLFHRYAKGEQAVEGLLDDYTFLVYGLLELYETKFDDKYLQAANDLTKIMIAQFWDEKNGGFYFTKEKLGNLPKLKQIYDGALPSGSSVAVLNLLQLSALVNDLRYEKLAEKTIKVFADEIQSSPTAYTFMLSSVDFAFGPTYSVIIVGNLEEKETQYMLATLRKSYLPNITVSLRKPNINDIDYKQIEGKATAYVCQDQICMPPTNDSVKMLKLLGIS